jgi:ribonuclease R
MTFDPGRIRRFMERPGYSPLRRRELARAMKCDTDEYDGFRGALDALVDEGAAVLGRGRRYVLAERSGMITGTIEIKRGRFGFVHGREPGAQDLFVPPDAVGEALDGDTVLVSTSMSRGRRVGRVEKVVVRSRRQITGVFVAAGKGGLVLPDYRGLPDIEISPRDTLDAEDGDKVAVEITRHARGGGAPGGRVAEILGRAGTYAAERAARVIEFGLRAEFGQRAEAEAALLTDSIAPEEEARRADYTKELVVAIDPDDARDHDDAIHVSRGDDGTWLLRVHIADVAHFVRPGSAIDKEARARATSVYVPGEVFRMLPDRLSADLCSLRDGVRRFAKTVSIVYAPDGTRRTYRIERSIVTSARTLTYGEVRRALEGEGVASVDGPILAMLRDARALHEFLRAARRAAGSLDFAFPELRVVVDEHGTVAAVYRQTADFSHHIIEEFMLEANRCVAERCVEWGLGALYRIHEEPDVRALDEFADTVREAGLALARPYTRAKLQEIVAQAEKLDGGDALTFSLLRALKLARYYEHCVPHYALAFDRYAHFTSPIRRYPDLAVHRALDAAFESGARSLGTRRPKGLAALDDERTAELAHLAEHCSLRERAAERAERALTLFRQLEYLRDHPDAAAHGVVRRADEYGLTIELEDVWIDARAPLSKLPPDTYRFQDTRGVLKGKRASFRPGDRVRTKVLEVDLVARQVLVGVLLEK